MEKLTHLQLLQYAEQGIADRIGCHPCPNEYPEELDELEDHLKNVRKRIKLAELQASKREPN